MVHPPPPVRDVSTARRGVRDEQFPIARLAVEVPRRRRGRSRHWEPILNILMRWSFTARSSCRGFEISSICNAPATRNNRFCSLAAESGLWRPFTIPPIHSPRDSIENQGSCRPKPSLPNRYVRFRPARPTKGVTVGACLGWQPYAIGSSPRHYPPRELNVSFRSCHLREGPAGAGSVRSLWRRAKAACSHVMILVPALPRVFVQWISNGVPPRCCFVCWEGHSH